MQYRLAVNFKTLSNSELSSARQSRELKRSLQSLGLIFNLYTELSLNKCLWIKFNNKMVLLFFAGMAGYRAGAAGGL